MHREVTPKYRATLYTSFAVNLLKKKHLDFEQLKKGIFVNGQQRARSASTLIKLNSVGQGIARRIAFRTVMEKLPNAIKPAKLEQ